MICFNNVQKRKLYFTCLTRKNQKYNKYSFQFKQNIINILPVFTNYTDTHNVLSDTEALAPCQVLELIRLDILPSFASSSNGIVDCSIGKNGTWPFRIIFEIMDGRWKIGPVLHFPNTQTQNKNDFKVLCIFS